MVIGKTKPTVEGEVGFDAGRLLLYDGGKEVKLATLGDVVGASTYRGGYGAASLPTKTTVTTRAGEDIVAGQFVLITAPVTIAGIGGDDNLKAGDLLFLLGGDPAIAASWFGISRGLDLSPYLTSGTSTKDLPANTQTLVSPPAEIKTISLYQVFKGGKPFYCEEEPVFSGAGVGVKLTALTANTGVEVRFVGLSI